MRYGPCSRGTWSSAVDKHRVNRIITNVLKVQEDKPSAKIENRARFTECVEDLLEVLKDEEEASRAALAGRVLQVENSTRAEPQRWGSPTQASVNTSDFTVKKKYFTSALNHLDLPLIHLSGKQWMTRCGNKFDTQPLTFYSLIKKKNHLDDLFSCLSFRRRGHICCHVQPGLSLVSSSGGAIFRFAVTMAVWWPAFTGGHWNCSACVRVLALPHQLCDLGQLSIPSPSCKRGML